jgi:predicted nucleic acid-binding Zn ribbon protein
MPQYVYKNTENDQMIEVFQGMNDVHEYYGENGSETHWVRVFVAPNAAIDTKVDPYSKADFRKATDNKKATVGEMWDRSKELSEIRAEKEGVDPVKQKAYDLYSKERDGKKHPTQKREELKKSLDKKGIDIQF